MTSDPLRWLTREALAARIGVRVDELPRLARRGKLPVPSYHLGPRSPRWDRDAVDALFTGSANVHPRLERDPYVAAERAVRDVMAGRR